VLGAKERNNSIEIIRMLNREFDRFATRAVPDLYPEGLRADIDQWNARIYHTVNNGVYRSGFATSQEKYEEAVTELFETLDMLEQHLATHRYLCGSQLTEADWRLFPTLVRFDAVYHGHFKCNLRRLIDYPNLWAYRRELYQVPGVAATVNLSHIKEHYYRSHESINPTRIVPKGPVIDFTSPHRRERL
jgi:glutathionyl-hydroquinone reductase